MKLMSLKQFCALPAGVIFAFCDGNHHSVDGLHVKNDSCPPHPEIPDEVRDFYYRELHPVTRLYQKGDPEPELPEETSRWGMYDDDARFLVMETKDLAAISQVYTEALVVNGWANL